ncbi:pentapeptide repeat-containing protein [Streptomyces sp. NPDC088817]|uniref:pentapeptide repeat-containing protein n=1 Tax=unclassified Streptomyces TaxID=2593676 RepID=UPI00382E259A
MLALRLIRVARPGVQLRRLTVAAASAGTGFLLLSSLGYALGHPEHAAAAALRLSWCVLPLAATLYLAVAVARTDPGTRPRPGLSALGLGQGRLMAVSAATTALACGLGSLLALLVFTFLRGDGAAQVFLAAGEPLPVPAVLTLLAVVPALASVTVALVLRPREATPAAARPSGRRFGRFGAYRRTGTPETFGAYGRFGARLGDGTAARRGGSATACATRSRDTAVSTMLPGDTRTEENLAGTGLVGADLAGTGLVGADLPGSDLTGTDPNGSDLTGTDPNGSDLTGTDPNGTDLRAHLTGTGLTDPDATGTDLTGTDRTRIHLTGTDPTRTDPSRAGLTEADPTGAGLTGTGISAADLKAAGLTDSDLAGTDLAGALGDGGREGVRDGSDPDRPPAPRQAPAGLPWGIAVLAAGLTVEAYAGQSADSAATAGPALPGGLAADSATVLVGWLMTALGLALAGPGLTHLCGRVLQSARPGALRLLAGRVLMAEAGRVGRPLGVACAVASGTYAMIAAYDGTARPLGPLTTLGTLLVGGCALTALLIAAVEARQSRADATAALRRLGAPATMLRSAALLRCGALLALFVPLTLVVADLAALPLLP